MNNLSIFQANHSHCQVLTKEYQKHIATRQQFDAQFNENELVLSEFQRLKPDAEVYKLVGPILVKQELGEAVSTVNKRIAFIKDEMDRAEKSIAVSEEKQAKCRESMANMQQAFQAKMQAMQAAGGK